MDLLFDLLDANNNDQVSEEEFLDIFDVLDMRFKKKKKPHKFFHECLHFVYKSSWFKIFEAAIKSHIFEYIIDAFVAVTAIIMCVAHFGVVGVHSSLQVYSNHFHVK